MNRGSDLPIGWIESSIEDLVEIFDFKRIPLNSNERSLKKGQYPYFGANGQVDNIDDFIFDGDFVLLAEDGGYFDDPSRPVAYIASGRFWANNHVHILKPVGGIPIEYLMHHLNYIDLMPFVSGTTRLKLNQSSMRKIPIYLPPLNEQNRIVAKIEKLQSHTRQAREALETVPELLEQLRQSILAAAFRGDLTRKWREQHKGQIEPATELLKRIRMERRKHWEAAELDKLKAKGLTGDKLDTQFTKRRKQYQEPAAVDTTDLPELPEGWCWCWLSELGYMNRGISKHRPRNASHLFGGKYPFIQTGDISQSNGRITNHRQTYSEKGLSQSKMWSKGTVCITIAANIANSAILTYPACFPDSVVGILPYICPSEYIEYFVRTARNELEQFAPATAQKNINISILNNVKIPLAPEKEIHEIVRIIEASFLTAETIEAKYKKTQKQIIVIEESILSKALSGKLVPQDPNDEPASILLQRIRQEKARQTAEKKAKPKQRGKKMKPSKTK